MKKQDIIYLKQLLKSDCFLNNYLAIVQKDEHTLKIMYSYKVVSIFDNCGFAYLISWFCDGSITSGECEHLTTICKKYNDRF